MTFRSPVAVVSVSAMNPVSLQFPACHAGFLDFYTEACVSRLDNVWRDLRKLGYDSHLRRTMDAPSGTSSAVSCRSSVSVCERRLVLMCCLCGFRRWLETSAHAPTPRPLCPLWTWIPQLPLPTTANLWTQPLPRTLPRRLTVVSILSGVLPPLACVVAATWLSCCFLCTVAGAVAAGNLRAAISSNAGYFDLLSRLLSAPVDVSGKAWELLMKLPTNPVIETRLAALSEGTLLLVAVWFVMLLYAVITACLICGTDGTLPAWDALLDPLSPFRLLYSLQIVETLAAGASAEAAPDITVEDVPDAAAGGGAGGDSNKAGNTAANSGAGQAAAGAGGSGDGGSGSTGGAPTVIVIDGEDEGPPPLIPATDVEAPAETVSAVVVEQEVAPAPQLPADATVEPSAKAAEAAVREHWHANFIKLGGFQHIFNVLTHWNSSRAAVASLSPMLSDVSATSQSAGEAVNAGALLLRLERQCLALLLKLVKLFTVGAFTVLEPGLASLVGLVRADSLNDARTDDAAPRAPAASPQKPNATGDGEEDLVEMLWREDDRTSAKTNDDGIRVSSSEERDMALAEAASLVEYKSKQKPAEPAATSSIKLSFDLAADILGHVDLSALQNTLVAILRTSAVSHTTEDGEKLCLLALAISLGLDAAVVLCCSGHCGELHGVVGRSSRSSPRPPPAADCLPRHARAVQCAAAVPGHPRHSPRDRQCRVPHLLCGHLDAITYLVLLAVAAATGGHGYLVTG